MPNRHIIVSYYYYITGWVKSCFSDKLSTGPALDLGKQCTFSLINDATRG